jgi:hypothetical protein
MNAGGVFKACKSRDRSLNSSEIRDTDRQTGE